MAFNKAKALQEAEKLVSQGKIPLAIRQYLRMLENEPSELIILNTVGDLYVRERNLPEALKYFNQLADAYVREGFTVKAIAIHKKISKLDSGSVGPLLKLAELYTQQGLSREAREQYSQAIEYYRKRKQDDKVLELLRKSIQVDPDNAENRAGLAEFCARLGRKEEAAQAYLEVAQLALRQGDTAAVEGALKKATSLDSKNPQIRLFRARVALRANRFEEAEKIIASIPELKDDPATRELLFEAYLEAHKIREAEKVVVAVYRANPADFRPLASYVTVCVEAGEVDAAMTPLLEVADALIEQKNTGTLADLLRQIWSKEPHHVPALELLCRVCEQTGDEFTLPEVLEALGHACVEAGDLAKAEAAFEKLVRREPENANYKELLKQVMQREGKEFVAPPAAALSNVEMALTPEPEAVPEAVDANEATSVKEALENSDLFSRYGLIDKAVAELEKVLGAYPDQVDIHERILEISQRNNVPRAGAAAVALARIFTQRGDPASAHRYEELARSLGVSPAAGEERRRTAEFDLRGGFPAAQPGDPATIKDRVAPEDLGSAQVEAPPQSQPAPAEDTNALDLSDDFAALGAPQESAAVEPKEVPFNYDEARVEVEFYLDQGFAEEAIKTVEGYEKKFPGNPEVAELRQRLEQRIATAAAAKASAPPAPGRSAEVTPPGPPAVPKPAPVEATTPPPPPRSPAYPPAAPSAPGGARLGQLASDLASSLEGLEPKAPPSAPGRAGAGAGGGPITPLSGLLEELGEPAEARTADEDPETHYSLGVAFREMGLLDEAIGEFQKVVKGTQKGKFSPHFLQACTLLASSFMEKKMPAIAAKWYLRALEMPDLDEEATLAIQYDLGVAYEQSGETRTALEKFTEVYSQNIDYRDVAEKIRLLQQKA